MNVEVLGEDEMSGSPMADVYARMVSNLPKQQPAPVAVSLPVGWEARRPAFSAAAKALTMNRSSGAYPKPWLTARRAAVRSPFMGLRARRAALPAFLGDDVVYGGGIDWGQVGTAFADTAIKVTGAIVQSKMTPTQKAQLEQLQIASGINPMPIGYYQQPPQIQPEKTSLQKNLPFIIAGGAVLVGLVIMFGTIKSR